MAIKKVLLVGNPLLRKKSGKVGDFNSPETKRVMRDLKGTLIDQQKRYKKGGGIAAPQIGQLKQIVFLNTKSCSFYMINPKIIKKSKQMFYVWDMCLSCKVTFLARIKRYKKITVEYYTEKGEKIVADYKDYYSELIQHEIDHLNGILFIDYITDPKSIIMNEEWDKKYNYNNI